MYELVLVPAMLQLYYTAAGACAEVENTHTNVFSVFVFVQLYTGMAELTEYTIQVYNNCAHHARMKCTIQC